MGESISIGILHPGQMGSSVAAALASNAHCVSWASEGRSEASRKRASEHGFTDAVTLQQLGDSCDVLFSVCPPDQALALATTVVQAGFSGTYVDCNAISPGTGQAIAGLLADNEIEAVDGGIIGPPAWREGTTRLYLSGKQAASVAALFESSTMQAISISDDIGAASAMKMAYAGWTKGSAALLMNMYALAEQHGLGTQLEAEWTLSQPQLHAALKNASLGNAPKAWRFSGEMKEIAETLRQADLPAGAFDAAACTYQALAGFKTVDSPQTADVINALLNAPSTD